MTTPATTHSRPPSPSLFRRVLFAVLGVETLFLFSVIAVAQIFHLDPAGGTYWKDATTIALGVMFILVAPALLLTWLGGYALVPAAPLGAFAAIICLIPYQVRIPFDWPNEAWFGVAALIMLGAAAVVRYEKRKRAV